MQELMLSRLTMFAQKATLFYQMNTQLASILEQVTIKPEPGYKPPSYQYTPPTPPPPPASEPNENNGEPTTEVKYEAFETVDAEVSKVANNEVKIDDVLIIDKPIESIE